MPKEDFSMKKTFKTESFTELGKKEIFCIIEKESFAPFNMQKFSCSTRKTLLVCTEFHFACLEVLPYFVLARIPCLDMSDRLLKDYSST